MVIFEFVDLFSFVQSHGYFVLFLLALIEGPITTAAGAFVASLGIFNIFIVLGIAFLGDFLGDTIYFFIGRYGGKPLINRYDKRFKIKTKRINSIEKKLKKHFFKTLVICKFTPMMAPPGIMMMGASGISFKRFLASTAIIIIPSDILYATLGYTLGVASYSFFKYLKIARELLLGLVLFGIVISYLLEKKVLSRIGKKIWETHFFKNS